MRYLITQSLVSAWNYLMTCRDECKDDALTDFLNTLNRVPKETTPEMQNGIDFENAVYATAAGLAPSRPAWEKGIRAVAEIIKGAPVQVKAQRELSVHGMDLLVFGIMDALKAGVIYDVKFLNKGFGSVELAGKYLDSPQHPAYFYIEPDAYEFQYLVSDGQDLYIEKYTPAITRPFPEIAEEFLAYLDAMNLLDTYKEKWTAF